MYSAPYGYQNAAAGPIFNGAPPQQAAHMQPSPSPNQQQQMMYNTQQFPMPGQPGAFPVGPNPALMGGGAAGSAGMMQNPGMPHMAANGQMSFQVPFTTSPYVAAVPSSTAPQPQLPANFMMAGQMGPYQMNPGLPSQQPMMQRMMPAQQNPAGISVSTPQRQFSQSQGTPTSTMPPQQQQFSTPQTQGTPQNQTPTTAHPPPGSLATPQTPTFPADQGQPQVNGTSSGSTPQSPATDSRDRERMAVLLEINQELLYESIQLVNSRNELKKEQAAAQASGVKNNDVDYAEEEKLANLDYNQCMRRLQANLTYMFALADRKGKAQLPPSPAYLTPPPLNLQLKLRVPPSTPGDPIERPADPVADRAERDQLLKSLYKKLHTLYPGIDPNKEPPAQPPAGVRPSGGAPGGAPAAPTTEAGGGGGGGGAGPNPTHNPNPNNANVLAGTAAPAPRSVAGAKASPQQQNGGVSGAFQVPNQNSPAPGPGRIQGTSMTSMMAEAAAPGLV
ncbi:hypothetical protein MYCTH_74772 [Thermothelomyces thermophilus ATCC 42464]|uniref:Uncharacterized protein n=1 Tax=Thermothelomyces thermophilus (strain ATCC 42464 / BCRC 31852 / DSM 1799) TaxID=573729 RepID=G2QL33_THET4|nr:uncharacterized protein MYCTH_74772 [Thermothelomyces thermophilus ATCC 42464]AEO60665.1 hypothetical protein MYCTH_74772 [Thermothelomyces thermophilus ATCC 42464]